jgi:phthalate 4,5-dioxygenase
MLSKEENDRLTRVGPGTPMGETMRRYWIPALLSWELPEPDGEPVRVSLLGEELLAFRTTDGEIGMIEEFCPHRGVSLWLGRNEDNGIRCVFHGWKFDRNGQCVEQMNEPQPFCHKIKITSYPTIEFGGVVWTYMGPRDRQPAPPQFDWTNYQEPHMTVSKVIQECNWLQALEGGIDTSHFTIMHRALKKNPLQPGVGVDDPGLKGGAPTLEVDVTDYGYAYYGIRPMPDGREYVRGYHFIMPFTQLRPPGPNKKQVHGHFWVPMDDENCMVWNFYYSYEGEDMTTRVSNGQSGNAYGNQVDPKTFRSIRNRSNNWMIDRKMQKTETFTGIEGINQQDRAVQESMKPIVDRTREHLGPADKAIIATRRLLFKAIESVEKGDDPQGVSPSYYELRAAEGTFDTGVDWRHELFPIMYPQTHGPAPKTRAAE